MENAVNHSLVPGRDCVGNCFSTTPPPDDGSPVAVPYIAQFWPISLTKIYYCHPMWAPSSSRLPARYLPIYQPFIDLGDATGTSALVVPIFDLISPATQTSSKPAMTVGTTAGRHWITAPAAQLQPGTARSGSRQRHPGRHQRGA